MGGRVSEFAVCFKKNIVFLRTTLLNGYTNPFKRNLC